MAAGSHIPTRFFAVIVTPKHAADLRNGDVAFVNENQGIGRQVFKQGRRRFARFAAGQITGVVFNAFTMAGGFEHFQVETGALFDTLGFQQFVVILKFSTVSASSLRMPVIA